MYNSVEISKGLFHHVKRLLQRFDFEISPRMKKMDKNPKCFFCNFTGLTSPYSPGGEIYSFISKTPFSELRK